MHIDSLFDVFDRHIDQLRQLDDNLFFDRLRQRQQRYREARAVGDKQLSVAIKKSSARSHRRDYSYPIAVGELGIIFAVVNLQIADARDENRNDHEDDECQRLEPADIFIIVIIVVDHESHSVKKMRTKCV